MASQKGLMQLRNAEIRNAPYMKSLAEEREKRRKKDDSKKNHEKWLVKSRQSSREEKKRVADELREIYMQVELEWKMEK